jgi:hypothetical protein
MRHAKVRTENFHPFRISQESGDEAARQGEDFILHPLAVEGNPPSHWRIIALLLYFATAITRADVVATGAARHDRATTMMVTLA